MKAALLMPPALARFLTGHFGITIIQMGIKKNYEDII
jgi:hypothetical protein